MFSHTKTSTFTFTLFTITAVIIREIFAEICAKESHSLEEIRQGISHYKYCAFGCCKTNTLDDPCCPIIGPVSGIIISILGIVGIGCLCYCFCGKRNQNTDQLVIDSNRKSSTYSTVLREYTDCKSIKDSGETESGVYTIHPYGPCNDTGVQTSCDMTTDGGGWTIFQRRFDNSTNFYNGWHSYKVGFGNVSGEYWLGNDVIHQLTTKPSSLYVMVKDFGDEWKYAKYSNFSVRDESDGYRLSLSGYSGTAGDSLNNQRLPTTIADGMRFTTYDRDNDLIHGNCATQQKGGWWYRACHSSNLNGYYCKPFHLGYPFCNIWHTYNNRSEGMEQSVMMFRRN